MFGEKNMSYFQLLGLNKEPFSTSPDPDFFYLSREHETSLTNILIELRLKRGLSVILGDVGTGKTTLSRKLIQELKQRPDVIFQIILDPTFENESLFMTSLVRNFEIDSLSTSTILDLRQALEKFLLQKGVSENKVVVLIIDEAQKINEASLENLRVLLNYETNEFKLLQIVLLGQLELHSKIMTMPNFLDRISFKFTLNPLGPTETKELIEFRLRKAGHASTLELFADDAVKEIYEFTRGYPRKITMLCHKSLKNMIMGKKVAVDAQIVREVINEEVKHGWNKSL